MWRRGDEPALWRACHALASTAATRLGHLAAHDGEGNTSIDLAPSELGQTLFAMRLCAPDVQQEMQLSLSRLGQLTPVQAYRQGDSLELFDGLKRVRAACELSWAKLRVEGARFRGRGR